MIKLRPPRADEGETFFTTREACFRDIATKTFGSWDPERQRAAAARDFAELPVAIVEEDGVPVGYLIVLREADHLDLDEIAILPACQGRGLGAELVRGLMARARADGLPLRLSVLEQNRAQRLYARLGFRVTRVEPPRVKMEWP